MVILMYEDELNNKYSEEIDDVEVEINEQDDEIVDWNNKKYTDEEIDIYNLEEKEKELVKKGEYDPWDFEEEDLEEDDYYEED